MVKPFEIKPATLTTKQAPGFCVTCSAIASVMALFQLEDAVIIQRYCDKCLSGADYTMSSR
jgi:hypothetical protein